MIIKMRSAEENVAFSKTLQFTAFGADAIVIWNDTKLENCDFVT